METANLTTTTNIPDQTQAKGKAEKKSGKRIGYNYIILKSLKESQKNDVVKCLYIKGLTNFGICVIKEGSYGDSKDREGRDIKDRLIWQKQLHEQLQDKVRLPRLLGSFEENGNYYLVIERIKGKSLYKACYENRKELREGLLTGNKLGIRFLGYCIQIVDILETLHRHRVVHRDVTANNFMIQPNGQVAVIDMELSYCLDQDFQCPPFQLGTYGYMSPEQEAMQQPSEDQDIFSAGAIILQVWTGISPTKLTSTPLQELTNKVYFFVPDLEVADIIIRCLHPNPTQRPAITKIRQVLEQYKNDIRQHKQRPAPRPILHSENEMLDSIQQGLATLASPLMADPQKGWFAEDMQAKPNADKKMINKAWYASYNRGASGIIYLLAQAKKTGMDTSATHSAVHAGIDLIGEKYINRPDTTSAGLHFGSDGIAASMAIAIYSGLLEPLPKYLEWVDQLLQKRLPAHGIMSGVAGQGIANLACSNLVDQQIIALRLCECATQLLLQQHKAGCWVTESFKTKKKRATRGFANGTAGNIYFLLEYAHRYHHGNAMAAARRGLQWLMKKALHKNGRIDWKSTSGKDIAPWWCEGAIGISLTFLKAYELTGDPHYKAFAIGALRSHPQQIIDGNLSQCHGISGLGEIYLEAYRILKDPEWQLRADWVAQVIMHLKKQHPKHGPYWLVERERQPVANFMIGNSGVLHFLLRYCYPEIINMPMLGVPEKSKTLNAKHLML